MNKIMTLVIVSLAMMVGSVQAAEGPHSQERFKNLDTNKNNNISQDEVQGKHRIFYYYQRADKNDDGQIDMSEFSAFEVEVPDYGFK